MFNAQATYQRNNTKAFIDKNFNEEDHKFVIKMARALDESGIEKTRQEKVVLYNKEKTKERKEKREKSMKKRKPSNSTSYCTSWLRLKNPAY